MKPLFGITEAAVQSYTGIQACCDRMAQSVFRLLLFSLLFSLSLSAERGVDVHPADLLHLTLFLFVRMTRGALQMLVVECMVLTMASVLFLRFKTDIIHFQAFIILINILYKYTEHDLRESSFIKQRK